MDEAHVRATESVSERFTRVMNATTSRLGVLTDPSIVGLWTAPFAVALLAAIRLEASAGIITGLEIVALMPPTIALGVALLLRSARTHVVDWLATKPFPVENMNAVLNGLGETLEVTFAEAAPPGAELNLELDRVSPESFVTQESEGRVVELRIGVVDDTRNPSYSNHRRFRRVQAIVDEVLVPISRRHPIAEVRVK